MIAGTTLATSKREQALRLIREAGILRPRDLKARHLPPEYLWQLERQGILQRAERGIYTQANTPVTEHQLLAEAATRIPQGIVCLLSALRFHNLTTQAPFEVWLALDRKARQPRLESLPVRIVRFSGPALASGIEAHHRECVSIRVYNVPKTIADCFKYRNKIGLDVALEALREAWSSRRTTMDDLWQYASICRVANVMRPYLESLTMLAEQ